MLNIGNLIVIEYNYLDLIVIYNGSLNVNSKYFGHVGHPVKNKNFLHKNNGFLF